jgi:hypothetical protein
MIRKSMFQFGAAPLRNSLNVEFGAEEPELFRSKFNIGGDTGEDVIPKMAAGMKENPAKKFRATEALMEYIAQQPKREDHTLGKWGTVGAAITAGLTGFNNPMAGVALGQELQERPYRRAMEDYATKGHGIKMAADLEADMYGRDLEYQKLFHDWQDKQADNLRGDRDLNLKERGLNQDADKWTDQQEQWRKEFERDKDKMIAAGWKEFTDANGNMKLINTITKEERNLGKSIAASNLEVARGNMNAAQTSAGARVRSADAAVSNAATAATNAETNRENVNSQIAERERVDPRDEILNQAAAAKEVVAENPAYSKYVNEDGTVNMELLNNNRFLWDDEDEKEKFVSLLRKKLNDIRTRKRSTIVPDTSNKVIELPPIKPPGGF